MIKKWKHEKEQSSTPFLNKWYKYGSRNKDKKDTEEVKSSKTLLDCSWLETWESGVPSLLTPCKLLLEAFKPDEQSPLVGKYSH